MNSVPDPVLILGDEPRVAVTVARSLYRHGIPASIAAFVPGSAGLASRAVRQSLLLPNYRQAPAESTRALNELLNEHRFDMLMPVSDTALTMIADHYDTLAALVRLACPAPAVTRRVLDKNLTLQTARHCGLSVPLEHQISNPLELDAICRRAQFPLVAKPRDKTLNSMFKVQYLQTAAELKRAFTANPQFGALNLIQEFATGDGVGIGMLVHRGNAVAVFQHRRLREFPATGGVSVMAVAEPIDPALFRQALTLLRAIEWEGVAMVEFKVDRRRGQTTLMEVNGRYWGSISLAVQAGVDFPYYDWQLRHDRGPRTTTTYKVGMKWRWISGDLARLYEVFHSPRNAGVRSSRWSELAKFVVAFRPGVHSALWSLQDPGPARSELIAALRPIFRDTAATIIRSLLPAIVIERLRVGRALPPPIGRIYLMRQAKRMLRWPPGRARKLPSATTSILVVCHGNIIRSPMAAALLRAQVATLAPSTVRVTSAGTNAVAGKRADPRAIAAAEEHGIDLHSHQARPLTRELVEDADLVIAMDYVNEAAIIALAPDAVRKTVLLGAFREASDSSLEIEDPFAGDIDHVRRCYATLNRCVTELVRELPERRRRVGCQRHPAPESAPELTVVDDLPTLLPGIDTSPDVRGD